MATITAAPAPAPAAYGDYEDYGHAATVSCIAIPDMYLSNVLMHMQCCIGDLGCLTLDMG